MRSFFKLKPRDPKRNPALPGLLCAGGLGFPLQLENLQKEGVGLKDFNTP